MTDRIALRRRISIGLAAWLRFESLAGREALFSEQHLTLPLAQLLKVDFGGTVKPEVNHPVLSGLGRPGRPPQLDFAVEDVNGGYSLAVESKWVASRKLAVEEVLWDCVRLELAASAWGCDTLFVLAGLRGQIDELLRSDPFNPTTQTSDRPSPVLGLHGRGRHSVNVESPRRAFGPKLHHIMAKYPVTYPSSFVCGHGTQVPRDGAKSDYTAIVWQIRPEFPPKRNTFALG